VQCWSWLVSMCCEQRASIGGENLISPPRLDKAA
jgi:hypothetical protein